MTDEKIQFKLLIPSALLDNLKTEAMAAKRSISAEIICRLERSFDRPTLPDAQHKPAEAFEHLGTDGAPPHARGKFANDFYHETEEPRRNERMLAEQNISYRKAQFRADEGMWTIYRSVEQPVAKVPSSFAADNLISDLQTADIVRRAKR